MTRISDLGFQRLLLASFQRAQSAAELRQLQLASGKLSESYSGVGAATPQLISAEGVVTRASAYEKAAATALTRLQAQEAGMTTVADMIALMRERFVAALAAGVGDLVLDEAATATERIVSALNTRIGGVYVFGGVDGAVPPLAASSLADFGAAPDTDALFVTAARARLPVEEGVTIDGGPTALDVAGDLAVELKELANAESALGTFEGPLTDAQRDFLVEMVRRFDELASALHDELGLNGVAQAKAEDARRRNVERRDFAEIIASRAEDADIAEVVARLAQERLAVEAAARALAQATELSLLNFI
jgi:flagellar hook-associated protein 3 FlgL